jgi:hypothetical protein
MVKNAVVYFYPDDLTHVARAPILLDGVPTQSREVILANMRKEVSLTLGVLKSLYPGPTWMRWRGFCGNLYRR